MVDIETRRNRRMHRQYRLNCEDCGRRIVWWSVEGSSVSAFAVGAMGPERYFDEPRFQWQGQRQPFLERVTEDGFFSDVRCFHCGWERSYPYAEFLEAFK